MGKPALWKGLLIGASLFSPFTFAAWQTTELVSKSELHLNNSHSESGAVSWNGRYVAFRSCASTLMPNDTNNKCDIFLRDTQLGTITLVSKAFDGGFANGDSHHPAMSEDGRYIVYESKASDILLIGGNSYSDIYLYDRINDTNELISVAADGLKANGHSYFPSVSNDGNIIAFQTYADNLEESVSDSNGREDIVLRNRAANITTYVSKNIAGQTGSSNGSGKSSYTAKVSGNGKFVVYTSDATNIVSEDIDVYQDVYLYNVDSKVTSLVSIDSDGVKDINEYSRSPSISNDGTKIVFSSEARLAPIVTGYSDWSIYLRDTVKETTEYIGLTDQNTYVDNVNQYNPIISGDGTKVTFTTNYNNFTEDKPSSTYYEVFLRDLDNNTTSLISSPLDPLVPGSGNADNAALSKNGRYAVFYSVRQTFSMQDVDSNQDVYLRDLSTGNYSHISKPFGKQLSADTNSMVLSQNGRFVLIHSNAANKDIVSGSYDELSLYDRQTGKLEPLRFGLRNANLNEDISASADDFDISADGNIIVFTSQATNIDVNDTSTTWDVFYHNRSEGTTRRINIGYDGSENDGVTSRPSVSANGRYVAFSSTASNIIENGDTKTDIYLFDAQLSTIQHISKPKDGFISSGSSTEPEISADGKWIVYQTLDQAVFGYDGNMNDSNIVLYSVDSQTNTLITKRAGELPAQYDSFNPSLSWNGRYVVYQSEATEQIVGHDNDSRYSDDILLYDNVAKSTRIISLNNDGSQVYTAYTPKIAANGHAVVFKAQIENSSGDHVMMLRELNTSTTHTLSQFNSSSKLSDIIPDISGDAATVLFASDIPQLDNVILSNVQAYIAENIVDTDGDGIRDSEDLDDDNDGLPDSFELSNGLDPLNANDASLDSDNDGLSNLEEYLAGTDMFAFDSDLDGIADGYDDAPLVKADVVRVDINQNGAIDIPRIGTVTEGTYSGKQAVIFFDSKSGTQTSRIYMPGWFTGMSVKIIGDINGNGVNEVVVLGNTSDGKKAWVVFDSAQKKVLSSVAFPAWFQPTEFDVVPDYNGNNKDEILVLGQTSDGKKVWMMHDVAWRAEISRLVFPGWYSPASYSLVKDTNGNGFPELLSGGVASDSKATWMLHDLHTTQQLRAQKQAAGLSMLDAERLSDISGNSSDDAVLLGKNANNKYFIRVQDANTGSMVDTLNYPGWFAALDVAVQKDINSSGFNDVVTLGRTSDGKKAWLTHDSYHHNQLVARVFPAWYQPTAIEVIPDINGDGAQDILVEGETSDGKVVLMVQHGKTGRDIRVIVMPSWFATN